METLINNSFAWFNYVDPMVKKVPILSSNPMVIFIFLSVYLAFSFYFGPRLMSNKKSFDLRPYMLISNALIFGASAMGIPLAMYLTSWASIPWMCPEPVINPRILETQIYLGAAFFLIQLFTAITTTTFMILRGKYNQNPGRDALRTTVIIFLVYFGARQHPRGPFLFRPICEIALATIRRAYYILMAPGQSFRQYSSMKYFINYLTLLSGIVNTIHISYLFTRDCPGDANIKIIVLFTSIVEVCYLTFKLALKARYLNEKSKKE